ncbi:Esterase OVCA2 [Trichoplax sp. H2]|nr:Esterase OVCA2 [Trichoplax sp. H2]|eukprot:RDD47064.1 Esterase OVCA2 [Trichoplax sp. H2]
MADAKLKILCVHGYRQSDKIFAEKTGALRKGLKKLATFTYFTAPNQVLQDSDGNDCNDDGQFGWWFSKDNRTYSALHAVDIDLGYHESLQAFRKFCLDTGPYDGVLGFSQGACMVSIICTLQQRQILDLPFNFKFAIIMAGFKSLLSPHLQFFTDQIVLPSLHVFGKADRVIPIELSQELAKNFKDPTLIIHEGGHFVPAAAPQRKAYMEFLQKFI